MPEALESDLGRHSHIHIQSHSNFKKQKCQKHCSQIYEDSLGQQLLVKVKTFQLVTISL